jgi:hypothetical protein
MAWAGFSAMTCASLAKLNTARKNRREAFRVRDLIRWRCCASHVRKWSGLMSETFMPSPYCQLRRNVLIRQRRFSEVPGAKFSSVES